LNTADSSSSSSSSSSSPLLPVDPALNLSQRAAQRVELFRAAHSTLPSVLSCNTTNPLPK
jgi:hypothetical protein